MPCVYPIQGRVLAWLELDMGTALTLLDCLEVMSCRVGVLLGAWTPEPPVSRRRGRAEKQAEKV